MSAAIMHRSFDSMSGILGWLLTLTKLEFSDFSLKHMKALEIGTGIFFTHAIGLYVCGCNKVISIDKYKQLLPDAMKLAMSNTVLARRFLSQHLSHDEFMSRMRKIKDTEYDLQKLKSLGIEYKAPIDLITSEEITDSFGLVFSYTVMEHVPQTEIKALLEKSVMLMGPGAFCIHFVDLEDHLNPQSRPFMFLSSNTDWNDLESFSRGNRLRFSAWKNILAEQCGIEWRFPYVAVRNDVDLPVSIHNKIKYSDETDLRTTAFVAVGKKVNV